MIGESRVVTTAYIRKLNEASECDDIQVGAVAVGRLKADGLHVLVPIAHTHGFTEKVVCQAQLAMETGGPLLKEVLISPEMLEELPTAFTVLAATRDLVPMMVEEVDEELEALLEAEAESRAGLDDDEGFADVPIEDE